MHQEDTILVPEITTFCRSRGFWTTFNFELERPYTSLSKNSGDVNLPARIPILPISNLKSCDPWVTAIKK